MTIGLDGGTTLNGMRMQNRAKTTRTYELHQSPRPYLRPSHEKFAWTLRSAVSCAVRMGTFSHRDRFLDGELSCWWHRVYALFVVHRLHVPQAENSDRTLDTVAEGHGGASEGDEDVFACRFGCACI